MGRCTWARAPRNLPERALDRRGWHGNRSATQDAMCGWAAGRGCRTPAGRTRRVRPRSEQFAAPTTGPAAGAGRISLAELMRTADGLATDRTQSVHAAVGWRGLAGPHHRRSSSARDRGSRQTIHGPGRAARSARSCSPSVRLRTARAPQRRSSTRCEAGANPVRSNPPADPRPIRRYAPRTRLRQSCCTALHKPVDAPRLVRRRRVEPPPTPAGSEFRRPRGPPSPDEEHPPAARPWRSHT